MENKEYLISVIIPVYNVGLYLEQAINSIIDQTIGFDKIEVILINDGSTDNSEKICKKYLEKYPHNVKYIYQKNSGVSVARNKGLLEARGKYINFLDGDDYWEKTAFEKSIKMLEENDNINFVAVRDKLFDASDKYHILDYRFDENKIVDVLKQPIMLQTGSCTIIFRSEIIKKYRYDEKIRYSEDVKLVSEIIMDSKKYGIVSDSLYYQRKRLENTSATQNGFTNIDWYSKTIKNCYESLIKKSIKKYGKIIDYIQLVILYEFQWRFFTDREKIKIEDKEIKKYWKSLVDILRQCDDKNILLLPMANDFKKRKMLEIKYGGEIYSKLHLKGNKLFLNDTLVCKTNDLSLRIENIYIKDNKLHVKLLFNSFYTNKINVIVKNGFKQKEVTFKKRAEENKIFYDYNEFCIDVIDYSISLNKLKKISFYNNDFGRKFKYNLKYSATIGDSIKEKGYFERNGFKIYIRNNQITIK